VSKSPAGLSGLAKKLEKTRSHNANDRDEDGEVPKSEKPKALDASFQSTIDDIPIRLVSVVRDSDETVNVENSRLLITLEVKNVSSHSKQKFGGWSRSDNASIAKLTDNFGKNYPRKIIPAAEILGTPPPSSIEPSETARDVLAFEPPATGIRFLKLELSGTPLGKPAKAVFKIPAVAITAKTLTPKTATPSSSDASPKSDTKSKKRRHAAAGTPEGDFGIEEYDNPH
jgi:hypothetical protein